jgi:hypothetical protein
MAKKKIKVINQLDKTVHHLRLKTVNNRKQRK